MFQQFCLKFTSATVHIQATAKDDRAASSAAQAKTLHEMLIAHGKAFKPTQRNAVERMLSSASSEVWKVEDLSSMLKTIEAINASACARRGAQK